MNKELFKDFAHLSVEILKLLGKIAIIVLFIYAIIHYIF